MIPLAVALMVLVTLVELAGWSLCRASARGDWPFDEEWDDDEATEPSGLWR